ncbi:helix-turn-helix transcriptional regulator [Thermodesulfitimonas autotrophica]|uniref:helix-turn-helix transcriptional regulator n=1 Tax=Thermodesulfitimonas autotrophica TaxID=1894989 RepID=UPI002FE095EE
MQKLRLLITKRSPLIDFLVEALRQNPGFEVLEGSLADLAEEAARVQPDLLLLEELGDEDLLPLAEIMRARFPFAKLVLLAREVRGRDIRSLQRAGVAACLPVRWPPRRLAQAVDLVANMNAFVAPAGSGRPLGEDISSVLLTPREKELLSLLGANLSPKEIAPKLFLTEGTVQTQLYRLYKKIGVRSRTEALIWALKHGFGLSRPSLQRVHQVLPEPPAGSGSRR